MAGNASKTSKCDYDLDDDAHNDGDGDDFVGKYVNNDDENDGAKSYDDAQNYQNYENYDENAQNGDDDDDAQEKGSEGASYGPAHITGFRCYCHQN